MAGGSGTSSNGHQPSTSSGAGVGKHQKIPKKKYHETCFSDDYQSTSSDDEEPVVRPAQNRAMTRRQMSMPNIMRLELEEEDISVEVSEVGGS